MEGLALELVAATARHREKIAERKPPRWLEQARELLHARFADTLSLQAVAASVGVHPAHLARVFRQQYRCSVGAYLRKLRIEFACRQIATSDKSLTEIALAAGFADQSHFSKTFKSLKGMTPSEYQRNFC
jgi:AraC family transcriptional regulator